MIKRVLIIDDEANVSKLYEDYLTENGFVVESINNPMGAVDKFTVFQPDLVLLDINMPDKDGFTLLREIKKVNPSVPIYFLTAHDEHKRNFNSLYAEEFILKSRDPKVIIKLIKNINENSETAASC
ncbi:MAG: response regulator [Calditerrivibrio sp.]|nr:response regulator [Calditerrivibrio sp.]